MEELWESPLTVSVISIKLSLYRTRTVITMARLTGVGYQDFEKLRMHNSFYVDKSRFIMEW